MSNVIVEAPDPLGPLSLQLFATGGHAVGGRLLLSSTTLKATFTGIAPGDYVLVATRPNGEELTQGVHVAQADAEVKLAPPTGKRSPSEFLTEAARRGLVPTVAETVPQDTPLSSAVLSVTGPSGFALNAILSSRRRMRSSAGTRDQVLAIHVWSRGPNSTPPQYQWRLSPDYLQLAFHPAPATGVHAIGLLDPNGIGPIVMVPPFVNGLDLTFIARGSASVANAKRVLNPSAARVPVAIARPRDPKLADLLAGLAATVLPGAPELWVAGGDPQQSQEAMEFLLDKGQDPIGAIIAGLFLARFEPKLVPLGWLRRLAQITAPYAADGSILLARHLIRYSDPDSASPREEISSLLHRAAKAWSLFASSRTQLVESRQLLGLVESTTSESPSGEAETAVATAGTYLDLAADAGGLEAFWGGGPESPGRALRDGRPDPTFKVTLRDTHFVPA